MKQTTKNILGVGAIILLSSGVAGLTTYKLLQSNEAATETSFNEMFKQNPNVKLAAFDAVNAQPVDLTQAAENSLHAVVHIRSTQEAKTRTVQQAPDIFDFFFGDGRGQQRQVQTQPRVGFGSGVIISKDGYIVTNDHIYAEVPSAKFKIYTSDNKEYDAQYVAGDQVSDLAVLKIDGSGFKAAQFGDSAQLNFGESVVAIGRPSDATDDSSITKGIISSVGRRVRTTSNYSAKLIQTDSAINPGSSGGALVNMYSQVVGITSSKLAGTEYDAVGYAIPTRTVKRIVSELISKGKVVSRARLGITYTAINSVTAEINGYSSVGLYVASVSEDSDLHGKVAEGDVITRINNIEVTSDDIVLDIIEECSAGDTISVTVLTKGGAEKTFDAVLKANTGESSYSTKAPSSSNSKSGDSSSSGGTFDFPFGE